MIAEFDRMAADLDREIQPSRSAPASTIRAFRLSDLCQGRDDPARQSQALGRRAQGSARGRPQAALGEAFEELKKVELLDERDQLRERAAEDAREQAELDRIGAMRVAAGVRI